ncbi:amidohydrolase [Paenarthrobacter sp. YAF11_1]|uniref:amidohydrolase n=1 Tax=Paenarthrobacter sp. YAF11_1 TaxID=3233074 RepID=UPI003F9915C0
MNTVNNFAVVGSRIYTSDPSNEWVEAFAVTEGRISAIGSAEEVIASTGRPRDVLNVGNRLVLPGLVDVHAHLGLGGRQLAFELPLQPTDSIPAILDEVSRWSATLPRDGWVIGGIIGSTVLEQITRCDLLALDAAAGGRPVLLRDDTMHNRWVSSRTLELMGVTTDSLDPAGGRYVRDSKGCLTGVVHEMASAHAEEAAADGIDDPDTYHDLAFAKAVQTLNSFGITGVQESATMAYALESLQRLDSVGHLTAHVVASMPSRPFIEPGVTGDDLYDIADLHHSKHLHPTFAKYVLDGVPMTRTAAMLEPYLCSHDGLEPNFVGDTLWHLDDLVQSLESLIDRGLHAKIHATGDAAIRLALDAAEMLRSSRGSGPIVQIAHAAYIDQSDVHRFAKWDVVADCSPYLWFPSVMTESNAHHVPADVHSVASPLRDLMLDGALVSAGSDWPCAAPTPDPWTGLATLVTRRNPDPTVPGELNPDQALNMEQAVAAFTRLPASAMGLGTTTGMLKTGLSADFIILDRDIFAVSPAIVHETKVLRTYFEGRCVHDNGTRLHTNE